MNHHRQYILLVALAVSISGSLLGFHLLGSASTGPAINNFFGLIGLMAGAALVRGLIGIPETKGKALEELEGLLVRN